MTLEYQAKEVASAVAYYSQAYSIEPHRTLNKPFQNVLAAYYLSAFSGGQNGIAQTPGLDEKAEYSKTFNADNTRMTETSTISMKQLDESTSTDLQNLINRFKE